MDEVLLHALAKPPAKRKKARSVSNKPTVKRRYWPHPKARAELIGKIR